MPANSVTIARAVEVLLTPAVLAAAGEVVREYVPHRSLEEIRTLYVSIVVRDESHERLTRAPRSTWQREVTVDIAVQKRVADRDETDDMLAYAETLVQLIEDGELQDNAGALMGVQIVPLADPGHLDQFGVLTTVIRAVYRKGRSA